MSNLLTTANCYFVFSNISFSKMGNKLIRDKRFLHVNYLEFDGQNWLVVDKKGAYIDTRILTLKSSLDNNEFPRRLAMRVDVQAIVGVERIQEPAKICSSWLQSMTCNELCRRISRVKIPFTLTPKHLYLSLLANAERSNYKLFLNWSRNVQ